MFASSKSLPIYLHILHHLHLITPKLPRHATPKPPNQRLTHNYQNDATPNRMTAPIAPIAHPPAARSLAPENKATRLQQCPLPFAFYLLHATQNLPTRQGRTLHRTVFLAFTCHRSPVKLLTPARHGQVHLPVNLNPNPSLSISPTFLV